MKAIQTTANTLEGQAVEILFALDQAESAQSPDQRQKKTSLTIDTNRNMITGSFTFDAVRSIHGSELAFDVKPYLSEPIALITPADPVQ